MQRAAATPRAPGFAHAAAAADLLGDVLSERQGARARRHRPVAEGPLVRHGLVRDAMAPVSAQQEAWFTRAPVASSGVETFTVLTEPRQQALVDVSTVSEVRPFETFGTFHLSVHNHGIGWFGRTLLALVETPGGAHASTAIILFG